ncbi:MAG: sigma-70 family RNA polymerase sigma factor [Kofleriaceae bacterium]
MADLDEAVVRAAAAAFPRLPADAAVEHVRAAIAAGGSPVHVVDLVLAWAVSRGDSAAVARFEAYAGPELAAAARKIDRDPAFVDEISQRTRVRLLVGEPPRIALYRGAGPLRGWVAIAAQRMALNAKRELRPTTSDDDVLAEVVDREPDPELRHLRTLYRAELRASLIEALAALPDRQRALLRLRFVEALELAQIGRLYRVHESTASRWIAQALEAIGRATRERLIARLAVTAATADSVARMVQSQLDLSVARLLRE